MREAIRQLQDMSPAATQRLLDLIHHKDGKVCVAACKLILEKTIPKAVAENPMSLPEDILRRTQSEQLAYLTELAQSAAEAAAILRARQQAADAPIGTDTVQ